MPFIGTQPDVGGYSVLDNLTASATASYTLQKNSANFTPSSANQLLVSLNGVIQKPGTSFTVSGSTLTFSSALTSGDSIDFILAMGEPLLVGTPSDGTVDANKLATNAVTSAKLASSAVTDAKVASGISASKLTTGTLPTAQMASGTVLQTKFINQFVNASPTTFTVTGAIGGGGLFGGSQGNRTYNQAGSTITITPSSTSSKLVVYATVYFTSFAAVATTAHGIMVSLNDNANTGGTGANPALETGDFPFYPTTAWVSSAYWPPQTITGVFSPNVTTACELKLRVFGYRESSGTHNISYRGYGMVVQEIAG